MYLAFRLMRLGSFHKVLRKMLLGVDTQIEVSILDLQTVIQKESGPKNC